MLCKLWSIKRGINIKLLFSIPFLLIFLPLVSQSASYNNATWVQGNFLREYYYSDLPIKIPVTKGDRDQFISTLEKHHIRYAYIFLSPFLANGELPTYNSSSVEVLKFKELKKLSPNTKFIPWIGGIQNKSVFLNSPAWRKRAYESTVKILKIFEVNQVHINFEYLLYEKAEDKKINYGKNFNLFFKELRGQAPKGTYISTVVASTSKLVTPFKYKHSVEELNEVIPYIDQLNLLFYDTKIFEPKKYQEAFHEQVVHIKKFKKDHPKLDIQIGMGTFENGFPPARKYRDSVIEEPYSYLRTLKSEIADRPGVIQGVSIFSEWLTTPQQWNIFYSNWVKQSE